MPLISALGPPAAESTECEAAAAGALLDQTQHDLQLVLDGSRRQRAQLGARVENRAQRLGHRVLVGTGWRGDRRKLPPERI